MSRISRTWRRASRASNRGSGPAVQRAYADLGALDAARGDLTALMRQDEQIAEEYDQELAARQAQVDAAIAAGSAA